MRVNDLKNGDFFHIKGTKDVYLYLNNRPYKIEGRPTVLGPTLEIELIGKISPDYKTFLFPSIN